jgi:3-oxoacyl-[acyl-carrier-protein] synthase-1
LRTNIFIEGIGFGHEPAPIESGRPLRADGLKQAIQAAFADSGLTFDDVHYRLVDTSGEQYGFKEATLGLARTMRARKAEFDIWHPADCIGEIGAATVPCILAVAKAVSEKGYAPGSGVLCHVGNDDGTRAAMILQNVQSRISDG